MTAVDVLAVLDREIAARELAPSGHAVGCVEHPPGARFPCSCNGPQLVATRAAVAELIAAAQQAREVLGTIYGKYQIRIGPYATRANTADWALHAALARVGSAA